MECFQVLEAGEGIEAAILRGLSRRGGLKGRCANGGRSEEHTSELQSH